MTKNREKPHQISEEKAAEILAEYFGSPPEDRDDEARDRIERALRQADFLRATMKGPHSSALADLNMHAYRGDADARTKREALVKQIIADIHAQRDAQLDSGERELGAWAAPLWSEPPCSEEP